MAEEVPDDVVADDDASDECDWMFDDVVNDEGETLEDEDRSLLDVGDIVVFSDVDEDVCRETGPGP